ncbi:D-alanyl-D-alanine carboxypeptidase/D-alanyl-D-alanine endopeptidase [Sinimarinibacterium thermocellulolyticum]|uniref:D-alanyl-D-alanine carboxypeptidase/D-alanyl-D-alanine-endopeptidase n=1 Tax=Sinimarinibacterium thermocellulolyticum TaxID=3170016 RepID=A0ABV2ADJ8_9GAMM
MTKTDFPRWPAFGALALALALLATPATAAWDALQKLQAQRGARVTAIAVDLDTGKTLQALNAETRLSPASLSKLVLAAAALETWPGDKTFATQILSMATPTDGRLPADLIVYSEGDATLDHQALWLLAAQVKRSGVEQVDGDLVVQAAPFGLLGCETKDRCDALTRSHTAYDAPLSAFGVDYGTWCVDVLPDAPGAAAQVRSCAAVDVPIPLEGTIQTRGTRSDTWLWLDRITRPESEALVMGGSVHAAAGGVRLYRSMADPALGAGLLLREVLAELGVRVSGSVRVSTDAIPRAARALAAHQGMPLREQVGRLLRYSNNYISDVLTLAMAAERTPAPVTTLASAAQPLADLVVRARRNAGYAVPTGDDDRPLMFSGSGLTPENRLSARDLVAVLRQQYRATDTFPWFYAGLVVPRQAPSRFLRTGSAAWKDRVALKTGTLTEPYSVFGTAGYLRKRDGGWIAFAALVNGERRRSIAVSDALAAIRKDVEKILDRY